MADYVARFRIDTKEYDANIKRAGQVLSEYMQKIREGGGWFKSLDDGVMEAVQSLSTMATKAENTRGGLRELQQTITELTVEYRALSDEDKNTEFGRSLNAAIQQLTERAGTMRDAMADVQAAITHSASDTRMFDQLSQGASVATAAFQGLTGAGKLLGVEMGDNVEVIAKLQAAMAVTTSLTTIQTAVQKQSALMQGIMAVQAKAAAAATALQAKGTVAATAVQRVFNAVANANPYVLLASAIVGVVGAFAAFSKGSKEATDSQKALAAATDKMKQAAENAQQTIGSKVGDLVGKYKSLQVQWNALRSDHERNDFIKNNASAFNSFGVSIKNAAEAERFLISQTEAVVNALQARAEAEAYGELYTEAIKNKAVNDAKHSVENGRQIYSVMTPEQAGSTGAWLNQFSKEEIDYAKNKGVTMKAVFSGGNGASEEYKKLENAVREFRLQSAKSIRDMENKAITDAGNAYDAAIRRAQEAQEKIAQLGFNISTPNPAGGSSNKTKQEQTEIQQNNALIEKLTQKYVVLADAEKTASDIEHLSITAEKTAIQSQIGMLQQRNAEIEKYRKQAQGTSVTETPKEVAPPVMSEANISGMLSNIKKQIGEAEIGSELYNKLTEKLTDTTTMSTLLQQAVKNGLDLSGLNIDAKSLWSKLLNGENISDDTWQQLVDSINTKLQEMGIDPIKVDFKTGNTEAVIMSEANISGMLSNIKKQIGEAEIGSELYNKLTEKLTDTTTMSTLLQQAVKNGLDLSGLNVDAKSLWSKLLSGDNIDDTEWQTLVDAINQKLQEMEIEPIKIDFKTGGLEAVTDESKAMKKEWQAAASAIQSVGSAMSQIEDPAAKVSGIIAQAIASVALGYAQALTMVKEAGGPWGWIAFAATGMATMLTSISAIKSATKGGFAAGGIVPGGSYSGDNLRTSDYGINSGELILTRAQQGVIADDLQRANGGDNGGGNAQPFVMGETIYLGVSNHLRRSGRGELVTTSMLRKMGIM